MRESECGRDADVGVEVLGPERVPTGTTGPIVVGRRWQRGERGARREALAARIDETWSTGLAFGHNGGGGEFAARHSAPAADAFARLGTACRRFGAFRARSRAAPRSPISGRADLARALATEITPDDRGAIGDRSAAGRTAMRRTTLTFSQFGRAGHNIASLLGAPVSAAAVARLLSNTKAGLPYREP